MTSVERSNKKINKYKLKKNRKEKRNIFPGRNKTIIINRNIFVPGLNNIPLES
ncbi:unnamed protein product [Nezara viridula]|uniref:Uncharacterized protein n=1 Tax=Nezara viridula TaxID=85310 RepID=A0A9P0MT66_NEZVI|nr:unnamed protein product [Nezara viridula]